MSRSGYTSKHLRLLANGDDGGCCHSVRADVGVKRYWSRTLGKEMGADSDKLGYAASYAYSLSPATIQGEGTPACRVRLHSAERILKWPDSPHHKASVVPVGGQVLVRCAQRDQSKTVMTGIFQL